MLNKNNKRGSSTPLVVLCLLASFLGGCWQLVVDGDRDGGGDADSSTVVDADATPPTDAPDGGMVDVGDAMPPTDTPDVADVPVDVACPAGQVRCGGVCRSVAIDTSNCGRCGGVCRSGETCTGGMCRATIEVRANYSRRLDRVGENDMTFEQVIDASTATYFDASRYVGSWMIEPGAGTSYENSRLPIRFGFSALPPSAIVRAARLEVVARFASNSPAQVIHVVSFAPTGPAVAASDYAPSHWGSRSFGSRPLAECVSLGPRCVIALDPAALPALGGVYWLGLRTQWDLMRVSPPSRARLTYPGMFLNADDGTTPGPEAWLNITYDYAP